MCFVVTIYKGDDDDDNCDDYDVDDYDDDDIKEMVIGTNIFSWNTTTQYIYVYRVGVYRHNITTSLLLYQQHHTSVEYDLYYYHI
jgi:hypothetical protein